MNTQQQKNAAAAVASATTPPLENDIAIQVLEQRLLQVTLSIALLREEHGRLQKLIGEKTDATDIIPSYQRKWKELQLRILALLKQYYKAANYPAVKEETLKTCQIRLRKTIGILGSIFDWELILPEDMLPGKQHGVLSINTAGLPGAYDENESFIGWLAEQKFIVVESKVNHNI